MHTMESQHPEQNVIYVKEVVVEKATRPDFMKPNSGLTIAILTTALCCLPFGIIAIMRASKVNRLWDAGYYKEADRYASSAKRWSIAGIIIGFIINTAIFILAFFTSVIADALENSNFQYQSTYYESTYDDWYDDDYDIDHGDVDDDYDEYYY